MIPLVGRLSTINVRTRGSSRLEYLTDPGDSAGVGAFGSVSCCGWHRKTMSTRCSRGRRCVLVWSTLQPCGACVLVSRRWLCGPVPQVARGVARNAFLRGGDASSNSTRCTRLRRGDNTHAARGCNDCHTRVHRPPQAGATRAVRGCIAPAQGCVSRYTACHLWHGTAQPATRD